MSVDLASDRGGNGGGRRQAPLELPFLDSWESPYTFSDMTGMQLKQAVDIE